MAEPRITTEMVAADLAAVIEQWNQGGEVATANHYGALAELLGLMPCVRPEHALLEAVLAIEKIEVVQDAAMSSTRWWTTASTTLSTISGSPLAGSQPCRRRRLARPG